MKDTELPSECCGRCRYWLEAQANRPDGYCRAVPPTPIMVGLSQPAIVADPKQAPMIPIIHTFFPQMMNMGWCGKFARKLDA